MKRENKPAKYKAAKEPRFGAGSEYGRIKKEQIHKRKYEEMLKNYKPEEQPWHLSIGSGRQARKWVLRRWGMGMGGQSSIYWYLEASSQKLQSVRKNWYCHSGTQYIDVSDECLPVCLGDEVGGGGSGLFDQYLRIFLPCTAQENIPRMIV